MNKEEMISLLKKGLDPLEVTIKKWIDIYNGTGSDMGIVNCALCYKYRLLNCDGCIIFKHTGLTNCHGTPYINWVDHTKRCQSSVKECEDCRSLALEELNFFLSLKDNKEVTT